MNAASTTIANPAEITERLFFDFPAVPTDVGLVLGSGALSALSAVRAAQKYHEGAFPTIIVSGGTAIDATEDFGPLMDRLRPRELRPPQPGEIEAHHMRDVLLALGVPRRCIAVEDRSGHTSENIRYSLGLGLSDAASVTVLANAIHVRRALMTLRKQRPFPQPIVAAESVYPLPGIDRSNWHTHKISNDWTRSEYSKTYQYVHDGECVEIDVTAEKSMANTLATR